MEELQHQETRCTLTCNGFLTCICFACRSEYGSLSHVLSSSYGTPGFI